MLTLYNISVDRYPFDKMECKMTFSLIIQQALRVKLEPKCQWNVPIDKANQKVSVRNSIWKLKLIHILDTNHTNKISLYLLQVRQFYVEHIIGYQLETDNQSSITVSIFGQRSFSKMFSTTYLPTICLLVLVQMTFYFPEENFQVRAMVSQGYNHNF